MWQIRLAYIDHDEVYHRNYELINVKNFFLEKCCIQVYLKQAKVNISAITFNSCGKVNFLFVLSVFLSFSLFPLHFFFFKAGAQISDLKKKKCKTAAWSSHIKMNKTIIIIQA